VWAFAPVQDRHAAGRVSAALVDLAACPDVEVIIVARGGGSLADLFAFCDESLCRTVSMLRVPVIASVGHHTDTTLIDDVAAVSCSTPTHAAEAAVPIHCGEARDRLRALGARLEAQGRRAVLDRARTLAAWSRAPAEHVHRHRSRLHQQLRELRASARRQVSGGETTVARQAVALQRRAEATATRARCSTELERLALALAAHDPQRTLERGYALVEGPAGEPVTSAADARRLRSMKVRLHDGTVPVRPEDG
jgi:exodeoxyribonuclease VII large subunit